MNIPHRILINVEKPSGNEIVEIVYDDNEFVSGSIDLGYEIDKKVGTRNWKIVQACKFYTISKKQ